MTQLLDQPALATLPRRPLWRLRALFAGVLCAVILAGCFVPDAYEAEIRLTKDGGYGITYIGILTYAPLYGQIVRGKIDDEHAKENDRMFLEKLKSESFFKEVVGLGRGRYRVRYEREGQFAGAHQMVTFVSRQEPIFRILTTKDANIEVNGSGQGFRYAKSFEEVGITSQGLLRITTDAEVVTHNAQFVRKSATPGFTQYDWRVRSLRDPPPRFVAKLAVDPRTGVPAYGSMGAGVNVEPAQ
jgi:hypothetical protein